MALMGTLSVVYFPFLSCLLLYFRQGYTFLKFPAVGGPLVGKHGEIFVPRYWLVWKNINTFEEYIPLFSSEVTKSWMSDKFVTMFWMLLLVQTQLKTLVTAGVKATELTTVLFKLKWLVGHEARCSFLKLSANSYCVQRQTEVFFVWFSWPIGDDVKTLELGRRLSGFFKMRSLWW